MDTTGTLFMPPGESTVAPQVDALFNFILTVAAIFFVVVVVIMVYFVWRYRRRGKEELTYGRQYNLKLELAWTIIPTILVIIVFFWGFRIYMRMHIAPKDAYEVKVTAQKWFWSFDYPNGASTVNDLIVPAGRPVKLTMSSQDVIHSFYVPDFRIKMDVLPNRYTGTWFDAPRPGEYNLFCAEYCGTSHSDMIGHVKVLNEREFKEWEESGAAAGGEGMSLEKFGEQLYTSKACVTCHRIDGVAHTGPSFLGIFGEETKLSDGSTVTVDENYIRESILHPQAKIVAGYQPVMPTYQGLLDSRQVDALIAYIKSLRK